MFGSQHSLNSDWGNLSCNHPSDDDGLTRLRNGTQGGKGLDHNPFGLTNWLAAGGIRAAIAHGATDEWSFRAVDGITENYDVHATILHALGYDHERLTVRSDGIDRRLTDVHGRVLYGVLG